MKKTHSLLLIAALVVVGILCVAVYWQTARQPATNTNNSNATVFGDAVEYAESYGPVCPLNVRFRRSRTAPTIDCTCPAGYAFDQTMIGGEECYNGSECSIFAVECVPE